jgi:hypothetical protein
MKTIVFVLTATIVFAALGTGCSSSTKQTSSPSAAPAATNLTGNWSGRAGSQGNEAPVTLRLVQSGTIIDGDLYMGGRGDLNGPIKGTVDGNTVTFALGSGFGRTSALQISRDGNQITGNMVGSPVLLLRSE